MLGLSVVHDAAAQCEPQWTLFPGGGADDRVSALTVFDDDGNGPNAPALFVGGLFYVAGGVEVNRLAKWTGATWLSVGGGLNDAVNRMTVFDVDGQGPNPPKLYVGGDFSEAGGTSANRIAAWDGTSWEALGSGLNGDVLALVVHDDDGPGPHAAALFVGGGFTTAGGVTVNRVAKWDGLSWLPLGAGVNFPVIALAVFDEDGPGPGRAKLIAGGGFTMAGGVAANRIARWDGQNWTPVGAGVGPGPGDSPAIWDLIVFDEDEAGPGPPALFAGGTFTTAGGAPALRIARWNGSNWSAVGSGFNHYVMALAVHDDDAEGPAPGRLYAGGFFSIGLAHSAAMWDGQAWAPVGDGMGGPSTPQVHAMASFDDDADGPEPAVLYAGGLFDYADNLWARHLARWDGSGWRQPGSGFNHYVSTVAFFDDDGDGSPAIFFGGIFDVVNLVEAEGITRFDGTTWSPVGGGVDGSVEALAVHDFDGPGGTAPALVVGGAFVKAGGDPSIRKIAVWNGQVWAPLGTMSGGFPTLGSAVNALTLWDTDGSGPGEPELYAGGAFTMANGVTVNRIARWTGATWAPLGSGLDDTVHCIAVWDPDGDGRAPSALYVGGDFLSAGGVAASAIARWDGSTWSPLGSGLQIGFPFSPHAYTIAAYDQGGKIPSSLYVGGLFEYAGGLFSPCVARWDGASWSLIGAGDSVLELEEADPDGLGPLPSQLFAGGTFNTIGGVAARGIARWDGSIWSSMVRDLSGTPYAFTPYAATAAASPVLLVAGGYSAIDGESCQAIATWEVSRPPGDLTGDCAVGVGDLLLLLAYWGACPGCDCDADLDGDCAVGVGDLLLLLAYWT